MARPRQTQLNLVKHIESETLKYKGHQDNDSENSKIKRISRMRPAETEQKLSRPTLFRKSC